MKNSKQISIITVCYQAQNSLEKCIQSVLSQDYDNIEYIIVDGGSKDGTNDIIEKYENRISKWVSEKDNGIYDAMNKGISMASGDYIGFLNADDSFANDSVISKYEEVLSKSEADCIYSDLVYVLESDPHKILRYWESKAYKKNKYAWGWMPAHPTFYVKRELVLKFGSYNTSFRIAADYEWMFRLLYIHDLKAVYHPEVSVLMTAGGASNGSLKNIIAGILECSKSWKINGKICPQSFWFGTFYFRFLQYVRSKKDLIK